MDDLSQPLIKEKPEVLTPEASVTTLDENVITRNGERDSSFIEIKDARRTTSLLVTKVELRDENRRHRSLPAGSPRDSLATPRNQSIIVAGGDRFILEESVSVTDEADDGKEDIDDGYDADPSVKSFINVHVSFKLQEYYFYFQINFDCTQTRTKHLYFPSVVFGIIQFYHVSVY